MRLDTQTHARAWVLTEAQGYRTYMHSACQFGSLGHGSSGPQFPGPLNVVSHNFHTCLGRACTPLCLHSKAPNKGTFLVVVRQVAFYCYNA